MLLFPKPVLISNANSYLSLFLNFFDYHLAQIVRRIVSQSRRTRNNEFDLLTIQALVQRRSVKAVETHIGS